MPKLSKSKRKRLKAEAARKAKSKAKGKSYSKHKEHICCHYGIRIKSKFLEKYMLLESLGDWKDIYEFLHEDCEKQNETDKIVLPEELTQKFSLSNDAWRELVLHDGVCGGLTLRRYSSPCFPYSAHEYYSLIFRQGNEYVCSGCKRKFTKEQYELLNEHFRNKKVLSWYDNQDERVLPNEIEPTYYYYSAPNKIVWTSRTEKSKKYERILRE